MFRNYFKVTFRNILKHKFFAAINILGMTIGVTACLLIIIYIADELSYDQFHLKADKIYQVGLHGKIAGQDIRTSNTCAPLAKALVDEVPDVAEAVRIAPYSNQTVIRNNERVFTEKKVFYADSNFFSFFSFPLLEGDGFTALKEPQSIVLTSKMAYKYFGNESPIGKLLTIGNDRQTFKVTGVAADCPPNSHFLFDALLSASSSENLRNGIWLNNYLYTYFVLQENGSLQNIHEKFDELVVKYVGPEIERFMGVTMDQVQGQGGEYGYFTTKLTDIHLHATARDGLEPGGNIVYVYFFGAIAILIMVIACINFMNLSTARSSGRAKEVGLRKTLGSVRTQMIGQFLTESLVYSFFAVMLSVVACYSLLPYFNLIAGKETDMSALLQPAFLTGIVALIIFVGIVAGSYPAFYLTSFNAVEVLKGKIRAGMKSKGVRSMLVVFQFAISIFLIIFTIIVYQQLVFMQERDLGIDRHNVVVLQNANRLGPNMESFKYALLRQPGIVKASYTNNDFPGINNTTVFKSAALEQDHIMGVYWADYEHQDVMKFELVEGRYFSRDFPSDSTAILLNEAAVKEFGFTTPLQEELIYDSNSPQRLKIIGVFKDFNYESLREQVRPLSIRLGKTNNQLMIRYEGTPSEAVSIVESMWRQHAPNEPFEYSFLDQNFDELFRAEERMSSIFSIFSGLAIFVACLGLFALAAFSIEQRTKEIGIRKVMGASVFNLTLLLSREFTMLVLLAFVPGAIVAWWVVNNWLQGFAYRIEVSPVIFLLSGVIAIVIAWITVGYQSVRAATSNPVNSLKYE